MASGLPGGVGRVASLVAALAGLLVAPGVAAAHPGIGSKFDAPVPLPLLFGGAALTVAATAGYLAAADRPVRTGDRLLASVGPGTARAVRAAASTGFLLLFAVVLLDGAFGRQAQLANLATVVVWPLWLKGVAFAAVLAGSPWRVLSPWRTLYRGLCRLEGDEIILQTFPDRLGSWPALAGVLLLGFVENLTVVPREPLPTTALLAGYALAMLLGGVTFGPAWFDRADALAVLYRLLGRVRVLDARPTGAGGYAVRLRPPWRGALDPVPVPEVGVVVAAVFTVSFDGFRETPEFAGVAAVVRDALGPGLATALPVYAAGFALFLGAFAAAAWLTAGVLDRPPRETARRLAPTVLPIAAAYEVAHNVDYLLLNAGFAVELLAGRAGTAVAVDPAAWLSLPVYWGLQVALVVLGHVVAVVAAHAVLVRFARPGAAVGRAHLPLTALMVAYTLVSLWTVSRPVVT
jgi:hypothetical protein